MTALHPPGPPSLATPTGAWRTLSAAMTAEIPAIAGRPVPVACAPAPAWATPPATCPASRSSRSTASCSVSPPRPPAPPARRTANATRSCGAP